MKNMLRFIIKKLEKFPQEINSWRRRKMKKIVLLTITLLILFGCGFRSKELNEETKQKIQQEISKINDKMSQDELENMMSVAKLNYDVNPEIGKMYFEKLVKYKPEASIYLSDYYYEKKDKVNYEKWTKYGAERDVLDMIYNLAVFIMKKTGCQKRNIGIRRQLIKEMEMQNIIWQLCTERKKNIQKLKKYGINKGEMEAEDTIWQSIMKLIISLTRQNNCIKK